MKACDGVLHCLLVLVRSSGQGDGKGAEGEGGQHRVGFRRLPADFGGAHQQQPPAAPRGVHCYGEFQLGKGRRIRQFDADSLQRLPFSVVPMAGAGLAVILAPPPDQRVDVVAEFPEAAQRDPRRGLAASQGTGTGGNDGFQDPREGFAGHRLRPVDQGREFIELAEHGLQLGIELHAAAELGAQPLRAFDDGAAADSPVVGQQPRAEQLVQLGSHDRAEGLVAADLLQRGEPFIAAGSRLGGEGVQQMPCGSAPDGAHREVQELAQQLDVHRPPDHVEEERE